MRTRLSILATCLLVLLTAKTVQGQWIQTNGVNNFTYGCSPPGVSVNMLAAVDANLFAATYGGIFLTTNLGATWTLVSSGLPTCYHPIALATIGPNLFTGELWWGAFVSTNNGTSWGFLPGLPLEVVTFVAGGTNLFAGSMSYGVFLSTDNGTNWAAVNSGLTCTRIRSLAFAGTNLFAATYGGVFLSTNNGSSWTDVSTDLANAEVDVLAHMGEKLFVGTSIGVFLSTNSGTTWNAVNNGLTNTHISALAVSDTILFAATYNGGVFASTTYGANWIAFNSGLTNPRIFALAVNDANLFAGANDGTVWRRPLAEVLPVQLRSFTARRIGDNRVQLDWSTVSETNNFGFYVERKQTIDNAFTVIPNSFVRGHGTSLEPHYYTFIDSPISNGSWQYRLKQLDLDGSVNYSEPIPVELPTDVNQVAPLEFALHQNYSNPFNPSTVIEYSLPKPSQVRLEVLDVLGQHVVTLVDGLEAMGNHRLTFDGSRLASGTYIYKLTTDNGTLSKRMLLMK